jgi:hypothetical protein
MASLATAPAKEFTLFPHLPLELRRAIWQQCRPHRVMELDAPNQVGVDTYCQLTHTSYLNMRPPVITRVCRESRDVAFENAGIVKVNSDPNAPCWWSGTSLHHHWFNPATDIVHLNWYPAYAQQFDNTGNPLPFFLWEATKGIAASITADILYPFENPFREGWSTEDYDLLEHRKDSDDYVPTLRR